MKKTTAITTIKRDVKLQEWMEQIKAQQESGMTVTAYCAQNGINIKTYYYHLRKVREQCLESEPAIVPVVVPRSTSDIHIEMYMPMQQSHLHGVSEPSRRIARATSQEVSTSSKKVV